MALEYGFYDSIGGDRKYNSEQMSAIFDGIINDGVYEQIGDHFAVKPSSGMRITVGTGRAWKEHTWSWNSSLYPMTIAAADPIFARLDTVYLKIDKREEERRNSFYVMKGNPMYGNPSATVPPVQANVFWIPLAYVTVRAATTSITQADIENLVGKDPRAPFVTGPLKTASIEDLFSQWEGQFNEWFYEVKTDLSGDDVAANLLARINERVKIADKATDAELNAGTNANKWVSVAGVNYYFMTARAATDAEAAAMEVDNKWVSPKQIGALVEPTRKVVEFRTPGTHRFTIPKNIANNRIERIWIVGAGESGHVWNRKEATLSNYWQSGSTGDDATKTLVAASSSPRGRLGQVILLQDVYVTPGTLNISIGKGGEAQIPVTEWKTSGSGEYIKGYVDVKVVGMQKNGGSTRVYRTTDNLDVTAAGGGAKRNYVAGTFTFYDNKELIGATDRTFQDVDSQLIPPNFEEMKGGANGSGELVPTSDGQREWEQKTQPGKGSDGYVLIEYFVKE